MEGNIRLRRLKEWAKLVLEAENSGNKTIWCQENGISYRKYIYWQKLVREYILEHGDHSLDSIDHELPAMTSGPQQLVDVTSRIQSSSQSFCNAAPDSAGTCNSPELMVRCGDCQIFVGSSVNERTLQTVLRAIRNA